MTLRTLFILSAALLAGAAGAEVPNWIADPAGGPPIWITADEARNADGSLRWELLPGYMREDLEARIEMKRNLRRERGLTSGECETYTVGSGSSPLPDTHLRTFLDHSELAVVGRVVGEGQGFYHGQATTLFALEIDRALKWPESLPESDRLFFGFSHAEIEAEGVTICTRNRHYPHRPTEGRRVLLFAQSIQERTPLIVGQSPDWLIFERPDGGLSITWLRDGFVGRQPDWSLIERRLAELR